MCVCIVCVCGCGVIWCGVMSVLGVTNGMYHHVLLIIHLLWMLKLHFTLYVNGRVSNSYCFCELFNFMLSYSL